MKKLMILLVLIVVGTAACKKEKLSDNKQITTNHSSTDSTQVVDSCGCGPAGIDTIANLSGNISYVRTFNTYDSIINSQLIFYGNVGGSVNVLYFICSYSYDDLPSEILQLKTAEDTISSVNVIVSGKLRKPCWIAPVNLGDVYADIVLTNIEIQ